VAAEERISPGRSLAGIGTLSLHQCFDTVCWMMGRSSYPSKPVLLVPKNSVLEQVKKEVESKRTA